MTASLCRRLSSPAAPPLEDDDLLTEILLRLPPLPSSLPRASAVSKRWRGIASDPRFSRRFIAHHRRCPPLLGCFIDNNDNTRFQPAAEAPNRIPQDRFSFPIDAGHFRPVGCRHGLVLSLHYPRTLLLVWDPVTGDQHRLDIPPGFDRKESITAAVLRTAGDVRYFQVLLVGTSDMEPKQVVASVYSSKTNIWGNLTTSPVPPMFIYTAMPAVMIGDSLYWSIDADSKDSLGILEYDLGRQSLDVIPMPREEIILNDYLGDIWVVMTEGGGLGCLLLSGFNAQLWKRKTNCDAVASWALQRTIALDKLLSINSEQETESPLILGYAEDNNMVLLWTSIGVFTVQLESLQFRKLFEVLELNTNKRFEFKHLHGYYPFEGVYTADKGIDGGNDGGELLQNK